MFTFSFWGCGLFQTRIIENCPMGRKRNSLENASKLCSQMKMLHLVLGRDTVSLFLLSVHKSRASGDGEVELERRGRWVRNNGNKRER